jgi:PAS domain S-box-containing protein
LNTVGYTHEEMRSGELDWARLSPPDERLDEWVFRQIEATGVCPPFEKECVRRDGHRVPVLLGGSFAPASSCAIGYVFNVTEQRRVADALRESEERYRNLVEHSPDAIFLVNGDHVTYVNGAAVKLLAASGARDIVGHSAFEFVHPDDHEIARDRLRQLAEGRRIGTLAEQRWVRSDGRLLDVEVFAIPFRDRESTLQIVARDIAERKQAERERARLLTLEQEARAQSEALSRKLVDAQESERRRIARELHDEIGQMLTGLSLILKSGSPPPSPWKQRYSDAQKLLHDLTRHVREMSLDLRPAMLDDLGLLAALLWQLERYTYQTGVQIQLHHVGLDRRFPAEIETAAYRFVQEALTNVARHARTREAEVRVRANPATLWVRISDRGVGFDIGRHGMTGSMGLVGMRERISSLGGELRVDSSPGQGTSLTVWLPLPSSESAEGS